MKALASLIRLHRFHLEEKRRTLAGLEGLMADLVHRLAALEQEVSREQMHAANSAIGNFIYGAYARNVIQRRETIQKSMTALQKEIDVARDAVAVAFQEVKRYEIAKDRLDERERAEEARRDQIAQDDLAIEMFRRKEPQAAL